MPTFFFFFTHYPPPPGNYEAQRRSQNGRVPDSPIPESRKCRFAAEARGGEARGCCSPSRQRPPPCAFPDSERGQRASRNGSPRRRWGLRVARSIAAGNSGLALSVRAPGLPAAPRPRLQLALSDGDAAGALLRSLRGNPEPPGAAGASFPPPRRPPSRARHSCACCAARWAPSSALPPAPGGRLQTHLQELNLLRGL